MTRTQQMFSRAALSAAAAVGLCSVANADHYNFTGNGDGVSWEDLNNWLAPHTDPDNPPAVLPGSNNTAFIDHSFTVTLSSGQTIRDFAVGRAAGVATLNILPGSSLTTSVTSRIGRSNTDGIIGNATGRVMQSGGSVTIAGTNQHLRMSYDSNPSANSYYGISGGTLSVSGQIQLGRDITQYGSSVFEVIGSGATSISANQFYTEIGTNAAPGSNAGVAALSFVLDENGVTPITIADSLEIRNAPSMLRLEVTDANVPSDVTLFQFGRLRGYEGKLSRFRDADGNVLEHGGDVSAELGDNRYIWTISYIDTVTGDPDNGIFLSDLRTDFVPFLWIADSDGAWSNDDNWSYDNAPNGAGVAARFGGQISQDVVVTVDAPRTVGRITFDNVNRYTIAGAEQLSIEGSAISVDSGSHTISAPLNLVSDTSIDVAAGSTLSATNLLPTAAELTKTGAGTLEVSQLTVGAANIGAGAVRILPDGPQSTAGALSIGLGTTLDITNNTLVISDGDLDEINDLVVSGRAGGSGIFSSTAAGIAERDIGIGVDGSDVIVKYTFAGDASLDGQVTIADLSLLASNWQRGVGDGQTAYWFHGDFNYDGQVTIADLSLLASNWQAGVPADAPMMSFAEALAMFDVFNGVVIPEPGSIGLLGLGAVLFGRRRCRSQRS